MTIAPQLCLFSDQISLVACNLLQYWCWCCWPACRMQQQHVDYDKPVRVDIEPTRPWRKQHQSELLQDLQLPQQLGDLQLAHPWHAFQASCLLLVCLKGEHKLL